MKKVKFSRVFFAVCCVTVFFFGIISAVIYSYSKAIPPLSQLKEYEMISGTKVFDKTGKLVKLFASEDRQIVHLSEIPDTLINAILAIEDDNFYNHFGIDLSAIGRAFLANISKGKIRQGASTITQQLARDMFFTLQRNFSRKFKEILLAIEIERSFSKDQILEMYLNKTYFGGGNYGIESAAQNYFSKSAVDLTLAECALLARLPQAPSFLNPIYNYDIAVERSKYVLARMRDLNFISEKDYARAINDTIKIRKKRKKKNSADYFLEYVRKYIENKYGTSSLYSGGLSVYTTMDWELTNFADSVMNSHLAKFEEKMNYDIKYEEFPPDTTDFDTKYVQSGVFAIDPKTGYVSVMLGGRNFNHSKFNRMIQAKRQPGSAFKPILYTTALANGFTAATMINDLPIKVIQNDTVFWEPKNYFEKNYGLTRLRTALKHSRNIPAIRLIHNVTPREVVKFAKQFGITSPVYPYLSLALGATELYPAEIITAYSVLANGGNKINPIYITRVEDKSGKILERHFPHHSRVISKELAYVMTNIMQSVVDGGTAAGIRWRGFYLPAAGKTGTTDNFQDAWCIAYTTQLVLGIWVGFDDNITLGKGQAGAYVAVPPWPYIMKRAVHNNSPKDSTGKAIINKSIYEFPVPEEITIVAINDTTGLIAKPFCRNIYNEVFIKGTEPTIISDTLSYNFEPIGKENLSLDTLFIDLDKWK